MGIELFHADGQTDKHTDRQIRRTNSRFSQFCERTQKSLANVFFFYLRVSVIPPSPQYIDSY